MNFALSALALAVLWTLAYGRTELANMMDETEVCDPKTGIVYKFFPQFRNRWDLARDKCQDDGGKLATINYQGLHRRIKRHINAYPDTLTPQGLGYWFGLNDRIEEGVYKFVDNEDFVYTEGWYSEALGGVMVSQPNNNVDEDCHGQDCGQLWRRPKSGPAYDFDDAYCLELKSFICEYPAGTGGCVIEA
ncbi:salivary C-type lectin 1-like [Saccoglossus kowalevskii]|uniref:C-type lectin domain family 17, member A-like n=1 Tax=Saccoglossus kowalevskii TaxID=10224 RepID=A0ABM0GJ74_SACKO|nr:PREDICTED: C-type lectin domain family 17, member A-like [Saccoglossus kowalevskii]